MGLGLVKMISSTNYELKVNYVLKVYVKNSLPARNSFNECLPLLFPKSSNPQILTLIFLRELLFRRLVYQNAGA